MGSTPRAQQVRVKHVCSPMDWWRSGPFRLVRCEGCGLLWLDSGAKASDELYTSEYFRKYYWESRDVRRAFYDSWLRCVNIPAGRVLDVGCGIGLFLDVARRHGFQTYGFEPSSAASEFQKREHDIRRTSLNDSTFPAASFDLITFWDVLAHVSDPASTLLLARNLLRQGGRVVVKTPNRSAPNLRIARMLSPFGGTRGWLHLPAQIYHFSAESLTALVLRCGFSISDIRFVSEPVHPDFTSLMSSPKLLAERALEKLANGEQQSIIVIAQKEVSVGEQ